MFGKNVLSLNSKLIADDIKLVADKIKLIIDKAALNEIVKMGLRHGVELGFEGLQIGCAAGTGADEAKDSDGMHDGCTTLSQRIHYYTTARRPRQPERRDTMTDKQFMEQLVKEAAQLPHEEQCILLGAARGMGMARQAQADAKPEQGEEEKK